MSTNDSSNAEWKWALPLGRALTLGVLVVYALAASAPQHRVAVGAALAVCVAGALYGLRFGPEQWKQRLIGLVGLAAGGVALVAVDRTAPGWLAGGVAIAAGLVRLPQRPGLIFMAVTAAGLTTAPLIRGDVEAVSVIASICGAFAVVGMVLANARSRAVTAERLLASEQAARESAAEAERYAERQRLAREIHDILAHTLSAQAVQLEGARLLLEHGRPPDAVRERIEAAQRLARDGLAETRRASIAARGDPARCRNRCGRWPRPRVPTYHQAGEPRPLPAQAALAIERPSRRR